MNTTPHALLGSYRNSHELLLSFYAGLSAQDANRQFDPELGSAGWYLAKSVWLECYWIRQQLQGDDDLSARVEHLFKPRKAVPLVERCTQLPPQEHLLNWARQAFDENLMRLATPGRLPDSPLLQGHRLPYYLLQEHCRHYEQMLGVVNLRQLAHFDSHQSGARWQPVLPDAQCLAVEQGHYRLGAAAASELPYDNERPEQLVELSAFRMTLKPVSNSAYAAFVAEGGYADESCWSEAGWQWRCRHEVQHPLLWRQNAQAEWLFAGLNGYSALLEEAPVSGINQHEAQAFCNWISEQGRLFKGAVLPHEYQLEFAYRMQELQQTGRVYDWAFNTAHPYDGYQAWPSADAANKLQSGCFQVLKGSCLHTQPLLKRSSYRLLASAQDRHRFSGMRLVLPPEATPW
ncbi:MAG: SUMF1/EgtB/PvdO family nonheme iron enzyme [gamma proteobacterium symbiont of Bathyaustriella thionipta]|nr:SUMF1/EgtB/PvdO family nonheme iron enzyme [gamma proteobacterium symbiont of Bathyaustriella thionipta]